MNDLPNDKAPYRIGVIGFSDPVFDREEARMKLVTAFDLLERIAGSQPIEIVSGLTNLGIPALAYEEADKREWVTAGVACKRAGEHEKYPVDRERIVGDDWGDESEAFLGELDALVKIGGGKQSEAEYDRAGELGVLRLDLALAARKKK